MSPSSTENLYTPRPGSPGALEGIRVLDLTLARAGPTCSRQLADMGADVIQLGSPARSDLGGSDYHTLHRNKRSILLDLKHDRGLEVFFRLVDSADVLVENYRAGVKQRLGIDYPTVCARNPRIVYASISGFGQQGPYRDRPGLDQVAQGMGGLMSVTGPPGSGPWRTGIAISDTASGTFLTQGVLAALFARERTGRGQWVHTSLLESMVNFMDFQATRWLIDGEVPPQAGNDHPTIFPMGTFKARDGHINIAAVLGWDRFLKAIDGEEIEKDARFADHKSRLKNRAALQQAIEEKLFARPTKEWVKILNAVDLPCGPVYAMNEVFADPQVEHLELTQTVDHAADGPVTLLRHPVTFSETPTEVRTAAPLPGAQSREILEQCGYDGEEIDALLEAGAVATQLGEGGW
ncbi:MAG: CoA transferase [Deltaproteobacteria bacterium]|nr:CoA transferase [Deltaproteobacteria bacterium]